MDILQVNQLSPGMIVSKSVYSPSNGKLLLNCGTKLTDNLIELLIKRNIPNVYITERYTLLVEPSDTVIKELRTSLENEIVRLAPEKIEANTSDKMVEVSKKAREIANKLLENDKLIKICVEMKLLDNEFLYEHSICTCALCLLVAGAMQLSDEEMYNIGAGALIHDLGMCEMPFLIRKKERSAQQEALWKEHSTYGYYFAKESEISEEITKLVLYHHERWNGSGFPKGLKENDIPLGSRIIAVCDNYDKIKRYDDYPAYQAIEYLYGSGNYLFDSNVVKAFTHNLAVYPLGSLVRLTTGEVGIVVNVRKNLGPRPIVRVYYNKVNRPLTVPKDIDFGKERTVFIEQML